MTPEYDMAKQIAFRNEIIAKYYKKYKYNPTKVITLGGAHCLKNPSSIERVILDLNPKSTIIICDNDVEVVKQLLGVSELKPTTGVLGRNVYRKNFHNSTIWIYHGTLLECMKYYAKFLKINMIIADRYSNLNFDVDKELEFIKESCILYKNGDVYLTTSEPRRTKNWPACKRIFDLDKNRRYKYGKKMHLTNLNFNVVDMWEYKNENRAAIKMHVAHLKVA